MRDYENLVKRLNAYSAEHEHHGGITAEAADAIEELIEVIQNHDFLESLIKPRWIPVTERLPEEYVDVFCYCSRNGQYGCGERSKEDNGTIYWTGLYGMIPTHWMPLPEPLKEEI